jgi:flagellar hook protein FlgE
LRQLEEESIMSIYGMMRTGASGMMAQSNRLGTVSDNIANATTTGYKAADTEFSSLVVNDNVSSYTSGGVETTIRYGIGTQGTLAFTESPFDLAIKGGGFLLVQDANGSAALTRAGAFVPNGQGELVNAAGFTLLGMPIDTEDPNSVVLNGVTGLVPVNVFDNRLKGVPTTTIDLALNLPASAEDVAAANLPSVNGATSTPTARSSLIVFGNLGQEILLDFHFTKTTNPFEWEVAVFDAAERPAVGSFPYASGPLSTATLQFDSQGHMVGSTPSPISITHPDGAPIELDIANASQLAIEYSVREVNTNGNAPSELQTVHIAADGTLYEIYENDQRRATYKIPLATVISPDRLQPATGNVFMLSRDSGDLLVGEGTKGGLGSIVSGALENSTVDLASELTEMIEAQRNYTANSRVFQTGAELLEVLVNLKR